MYVCCEAKCVVLELTFVKSCLLFFVYGSCRKEMNVRKENVRKRKKEEEKP